MLVQAGTKSSLAEITARELMSVPAHINLMAQITQLKMTNSIWECGLSCFRPPKVAMHLQATLQPSSTPASPFDAISDLISFRWCALGGVAVGHLLTGKLVV